MIVLDQFTLSTAPLSLYFNDTALGQATGFIWKIGDKYYLVSNWHVFSGRDFFTMKNLRPDGGRPNKIETMFNIETGSFFKQPWTIHIRDKGDRPLWMVLPGARRVDIAVLPLEFPPGERIITLYPLNVLAVAALRIEIGMDVFVLGYPFPIEPPAYPIWKRGSIASEPQLVGLSNDYMLVDTASRPGMSGAPVIRKSWQNHLVEPGRQAYDDRPAVKFLGVYSGRLPVDHPHEAQIGLVWDKSFIDEIIIGNKRDEE